MTDHLVTKPILANSLIAYTKQLAEALEAGWKVDYDINPPTTYMHMYEAHVTRSAAVVDPVSRADICANARSAKALKKAAA